MHSTEWEEGEEGKRDGEAGTQLSIFAARTPGPIRASRRRSRSSRPAPLRPFLSMFSVQEDWQ